MAKNSSLKTLLKAAVKIGTEVFYKRCEACNFIKKETLAQVFSCEFCEISKNIFYYRPPLVAASKPIYKLLDNFQARKFQ